MKCNATLTMTGDDDEGGERYECRLTADHSAVEHESDGVLWSDKAEGAAPHAETIPVQMLPLAPDPLPRHSAEVSFNDDGNHVWTMTVHGPAAFVARVVASVADAFEEDAQR